MEFSANVIGMGCDCRLNIYIDGIDDENKLESCKTKGKKIGSVTIGHDDAVVSTVVEAVTGKHAVYFTVETDYPTDWMGDYFKGRNLFELESFVFMK